MAKPTPLSPWFVVMRIRDDGSLPEYTRHWLPPEWYTEAEAEESQWTRDESEARLFNSLQTAWRVASASGAYCVVVADAEALKEFRPKGL